VTAGGGRIALKSEFGFGETQGHEERLSIQHPVDLGASLSLSFSLRFLLESGTDKMLGLAARDLTSGSFEIGAIVDAFRASYLALSSSLSPPPSVDGAPAPPALDPTQSLLGRAGITLEPAMLAQRERNEGLLGAGLGGLKERARTWEPQIEYVKAAWARQRGGGGARGGYAGAAAVVRPPVYVHAHAQAGFAPSSSPSSSASAASAAASPGLSRFGRAQHAAQGSSSPVGAVTPTAYQYQYHYGSISAAASSSAAAGQAPSGSALSNGVASATTPHVPPSTLPQNYFGDAQASSSARSPPSLSHVPPTSSFPTGAAPAASPAPSPSWLAYAKDLADWNYEVSTSPGPHRPVPVPPLPPTAESVRRNPLIPPPQRRGGKPRKLQYTAL